MLKNVYCTYDKKSRVYGVPVVEVNDDVSIRNFLSGIKSASIPWVDDIDLYRIGTFDDSIGELTPEKPYFLVNGAQAE